ncbi:receptor-like protein 7 isoform X2 [Pyrus x bretschneideri]|uniref:receptor-like protein 7 isoform X1 n=1 Tax=Pyrus x bretschneideri TaxID=225117 RepID=UPI002030E8A7|nr:receptor-like protein 7 isoform X1 [Pyrus x bretschneideri]XP_048434180.1 receptor-like protein 7 isoform X2 [Pyrus x bretschneideri]
MKMESLLSKFTCLHCLLLLLLNATHCFSYVHTQTQTLCHADEHSFLLQFKESFTIDKSASGSPFAYPKVASWAREGDQNQSNCCSWDGIECHAESGHVIGLDLKSSCLYGSINSNSTIFRLVHLQMLDLSDNNFNSSEIPSRLGHDLSSLSYLNLSHSAFSGQIPSEISKLSKLSTLVLSYNNGLELTKSNMRILVQNLTSIKQLHLGDVGIYSTVPDILVNASSLTSLNLSYCGLYGEFPVGIFHLPNLEELRLYSNTNLNGYFPTFNRTNSLKILVVSETNFSGELPSSIGNLHSLNYFDISYCGFDSHVPSSFGNLTQLSFLEMASFHDVSAGQFLVPDSLSCFGKLTKLNYLDLSHINLRGNFPRFVANLTQLAFLYLFDNSLTGEIPKSLFHLRNLEHLHLSFNDLQGEFPKSLFHLRNLELLGLSDNNLSGLVAFDEFSNLKKLKALGLSDNRLSVRVKSGSSATLPKFKILKLGECNLTEFPEFLKNQYELGALNLSGNNIHGQIPKWLWNATRETLVNLDLNYNFLTGFEENPVTLPWKNLQLFDLGNNRLQGSLPIPPQSITVYMVDNNNYSGEVSPLFCNVNYLQVLDLANNNLSGMLPQCLGKSSSLEILHLMFNSFHGHIPPFCANKNSLKFVGLGYNRLQGMLPRSMADCIQLEFLHIGNNQISDIFPSWLGVLPVLRGLILGSNAFHGIIGKPPTDHEFPNLCIIDLSNNLFSGMLPSKYMENWNFMKYVVTNKESRYFVVSSNNSTDKYGYYFQFSYEMIIPVKGVKLTYDRTPYDLRLIDFSSNRFEGEIPASIIGSLRALQLLNLSNNTLSGQIPSSLANLTALESLDLSQNKLSGMIPGCLAQLTFLEYFNVSYNHLWGPIPLGQQFGTFLEDSYQGNSGLCGKLLSKKCKASESSRQPPRSSFEEDEEAGFPFVFDWYVVLPGVVSGLIVGVVAGNTLADKKHEWFVEKFSRRRKPTTTWASRGRRT